jgi:hypothetical protein
LAAEGEVPAAVRPAPGAAATLDGVSQMRRWKLVRVTLNPALYNPVQGVLRQVSRATFTISYNRAKSSRADRLASDTVLDADALKLVSNAGTARAWYPGSAVARKSSGSTGEVLVVMTTDAIYSDSTNLYGLVSHKRALGYVVPRSRRPRSMPIRHQRLERIAGQAPDGKADRCGNGFRTTYVSMGNKYDLLNRQSGSRVQRAADEGTRLPGLRVPGGLLLFPN